MPIIRSRFKGEKMAVRLAVLGLRSSGRICMYNSIKHSLPALGTGGCILQADRKSLAVRDYSTQVAQPGKAGAHWKYERVVAVGLLGLIPAGFVYPCAIVDYGLAVLIPLHGHWGFESVVEDYFSQSTKTLGRVLVYLMSFGAFAGLMYLNIKDVGICKAVKLVWSV